MALISIGEPQTTHTNDGGLRRVGKVFITGPGKIWLSAVSYARVTGVPDEPCTLTMTFRIKPEATPGWPPPQSPFQPVTGATKDTIIQVSVGGGAVGFLPGNYDYEITGVTTGGGIMRHLRLWATDEVLVFP